MGLAVITGSAGLIGSEATRWFHAQGFDVIGIDNNLRASFFGAAASTEPTKRSLEQSLRRYRHETIDIRDVETLRQLFARCGAAIDVIIHCAAQPSHDWAARDPHTDFGVNAVGTLNLLECARAHCPDAVFIFTSTNKVYGDAPNRLQLVERETRWELPEGHPMWPGVAEGMTIDQSTHSVFGASKVAADVLVQEYGRYFGMKTACFRGGCLTGPGHAGAELHGFLSYLAKCAVTGSPYQVFGYKGKQVRDNIHSRDLVSAFWEFFQAPRHGEVYNIGGGRHANCSMLEAIAMTEALVGRPLSWTYVARNRIGDHIWYISDVGKFRSHYPRWRYQYGLRETLEDIVETRLQRAAP